MKKTTSALLGAMLAFSLAACSSTGSSSLGSSGRGASSTGDNSVTDGSSTGVGTAAGSGTFGAATGTTSDAVDGWFNGYGGGVVAVAWMGYDDPKSLGGREFGATLALPIWIDYMRVALARRPQEERAQPEGVVRENDDWVYAEFAESPVFTGIDLDQQPAVDPNAALDPNAPVDPNAPPPPQQPATLPPKEKQQLQNSLF